MTDLKLKELIELIEGHPELSVTFRKEIYGDSISIKFSEVIDQNCRNLSQIVDRGELEEFFDIILHNMEDKFYD